VRLGIVAPKEVPVHRQEIYEAIHGKEPDQPPAPAPVVVNKTPDSAGHV
jgi:carbon storage regulator